MKTKEQTLEGLSNNYDDEDNPHRRGAYRDGLDDGWEARESQSVAQADGSDVDAARNWVARNEGVFHGHAEEPGVRPYLAGIQHGRASEHFEARKPYDVAMQKLEQERQRSAKLVGIMNRISYGLTLPEDDIQKAIRKALDEAIADYERGSNE